MATKTLSRGSALLTALFIMTLIAIAATAMSLRLQLDIHRTNTLRTSDRLNLAAQAVTFLAMDLLNQDTAHFSLPASGKLVFPSSLKVLYPQVSIQGCILDLQARFNLNNLRDKQYRGAFSQLLQNQLPHTKPMQEEHLTQALVHWVSSYAPEKGQDILHDFYVRHTPAYVPAHQLMQNVSELRLVRGFNADIYRAIEPVVTALPEITPVNAYTASEELLISLTGDKAHDALDSFLQARATNKRRKDILQHFIKSAHIPPALISSESQYFLSIAQVSQEELTLVKYSVFKRYKNSKGKLRVKLISESNNTL